MKGFIVIVCCTLLVEVVPCVWVVYVVCMDCACSVWVVHGVWVVASCVCVVHRV